MRALVLGGAQCVWADADAALAMFRPDVVLAVNDIGIEWPGAVDHWVTLHPRPYQTWCGIEAAVAARVAAGRNRPRTWGHRTKGKQPRGIDELEPDWCGSGSLLAVRIALRRLAADRVVLAGVPLDRQPHFNGSKPWAHASAFQGVWRRLRPELAERVRSMSGWTRALLGAPTEAWFAGDDADGAVSAGVIVEGVPAMATTIPLVDIVDPRNGKKRTIPACDFRVGVHVPWNPGGPETQDPVPVPVEAEAEEPPKPQKPPPKQVKPSADVERKPFAAV